VQDVRRGGDAPLRRYAQKLDGLSRGERLRVSEDELKRAWQESSREFRAALRAAADNIRHFAERQRPQEWRAELASGVSVGQLLRPLASVGCYVPGGRYPLPSSLLMTVIPAQVAGVERIVVASPRPARETLAAAAMLGVREMYRIGGAQAIAALAYGTASISRVGKIVGPGNQYVIAAKELVAFDCAIDFLAGPTEVLILAERGDAAFIAADLVAQAEHDPDAVAVLITTSLSLAKEVTRQARAQAQGNVIAASALDRNGAALVARSRAEAIAWANEIAAEHITVPPDLVKHIQNAGSIFVGDYSPQAAGDYASGPNHVLPTGGQARVRGGLSTADFMKTISVQEISRRGLERLAPTITRLARAEGLEAHADSVELRLQRNAARSAHA
jgi:histidinol dehydrogenase